MLNLVIDLGNTAAKIAWFENNDLQEFQYNLDEVELLQLIETRRPPHTILSSVRKNIEEFIKKVGNLTQLIVLKSDTYAPFQNLYATPHTLGVDRIAGVVGAKTLYPDQPCLVIDLGTCITYDFIDAENNFLGGNIAPGLQMRFKAMQHFTAKLPMIELTETDYETLTGNSTRQAMLSGVVLGITFEIEGYIRNYQQKYPNLVTIACGGDAIFFETKLKPTIFAVPNLTLVGLNRILQYNVSAN
ncbi:MAG: type III pantothenate kinase [Microscillaceae bacterium]|nr:type III pantothenate kinase [Microscillaceae bacterium]